MSKSEIEQGLAEYEAEQHANPGHWGNTDIGVEGHTELVVFEDGSFSSCESTRSDDGDIVTSESSVYHSGGMARRNAAYAQSLAFYVLVLMCTVFAHGDASADTDHDTHVWSSWSVRWVSVPAGHTASAGCSDIVFRSKADQAVWQRLLISLRTPLAAFQAMLWASTKLRGVDYRIAGRCTFTKTVLARSTTPRWKRTGDI